MSEVTDFLMETKKLIDSPEKWIKGAYKKNGCYCIIGAIHEVIGYSEETFEEAYNMVMDVVVSKGFSCVPNFNDAPETTHADVMNVLDLAMEE